ncbi:hypothetical protein ABFX02_11G020900 [Erythranthe guttata]
MDSQNKSKKQSNFHGVTIIEETELSIFDAHKYFSETEMNSPKQEKNPRQHQRQEQLLHGDHLISGARSIDVVSASVEYGYGSRDFRTRSFRGTPTASSEASWNSRTGLLRNPPASSAGVASTGNSPSDDHYRKNSAAAAAKRWKFLGRKCCCTGGKSVQVVNTTVVTSELEQKGPAGIFVNGGDEKTPRQMIQNGISRRRSSSSFTRDIIEIHQNKARVSSSGRPFLDGGGGGGVVGFTFPILKSSSDVQANKSIVNSPSSTAKNPVGGGCFNQGSAVARDDDVGSDASSDLFEIESFSTTQTTSYHMYRRRDSADEEPTSNASRIIASSNRIVQYGGRNLDERRPPPSVAATECYPPSEVSVDWSVTTAEGFDRARIADSTYGSALGKRVEEEGGGDGGKRKGNNNGLMAMGCRQEKAVSVGPPALKYLAAEGPPMFPLRGVNRPPRANKPPLASSHSARLSLAFAA